MTTAANQPSSASPTTTTTTAATTATTTVVLKRIDPLTAARTAFIVALAVGVTMLVAFMLLWVFLSATGVFDAILGTFGDVFSTGGGVSFFSLLRTFGFALVVVAVQILATTAIAALYAIIYNLTVKYTGGIRVDLAQK